MRSKREIRLQSCDAMMASDSAVTASRLRYRSDAQVACSFLQLARTFMAILNSSAGKRSHVFATTKRLLSLLYRLLTAFLGLLGRRSFGTFLYKNGGLLEMDRHQVSSAVDRDVLDGTVIQYIWMHVPNINETSARKKKKSHRRKLNLKFLALEYFFRGEFGVISLTINVLYLKG